MYCPTRNGLRFQINSKVLAIEVDPIRGCPCRKLNSDVLVMQSAQDWHRQNTADGLTGRVNGESLFKDRCVRVRL